LVYAEAHGHSPRMMRMAALVWAGLRVAAPGRSAAGRAASQAVARGLVPPVTPGISELASFHNERYGFHLSH
jgi:hypothetical protein